MRIRLRLARLHESKALVKGNRAVVVGRDIQNNFVLPKAAAHESAVKY